ncbi:MAG TPA: DUF805 domain-containing protein [Stenotrophomonas sp.]|nr:DUF805 domain-containing protein [Stenotrophomonas sp.]
MCTKPAWMAGMGMPESTMMQRIGMWLGWRSRLGRRGFAGRTLLTCTAFALSYALMAHLIGTASTWLLYPFLFASLFSVSVRRLHDQGRAATWLFLVLVPLAGPLVLGLLLLCRRGNAGDNRYGVDPRTAGLDYLQVNAFERV